MSEQTKVTKAKVIFARTCIVLTGLVLATGGVLAWMNARSAAPAAGQDPYDYETSIAKLKKVGQALQIYRAEYGFKPVAERKTYSDAGLPPSMSVLAWAGHSWSLPGGLDEFRVPNPSDAMPGPGSHFTEMYWKPSESLGDMTPYFASRGEDLPIMMDVNMNRARDLMDRSRQLPAVILRLSGKVDRITFDNRRKDVHTK